MRAAHQHAGLGRELRLVFCRDRVGGKSNGARLQNCRYRHKSQVTLAFDTAILRMRRISAAEITMWSEAANQLWVWAILPQFSWREKCYWWSLRFFNKASTCEGPAWRPPYSTYLLIIEEEAPAMFARIPVTKHLFQCFLSMFTIRKALIFGNKQRKAERHGCKSCWKDAQRTCIARGAVPPIGVLSFGNSHFALCINCLIITASPDSRSEYCFKAANKPVKMGRHRPSSLPKNHKVCRSGCVVTIWKRL